jgi:hypothetical protein
MLRVKTKRVWAFVLVLTLLVSLLPAPIQSFASTGEEPVPAAGGNPLEAGEPDVDTAALTEAVFAAQQLAATAADYEDNAYSALTAAILAAEDALQALGLTQEQIDAQTASLAAAHTALALKAELGARLAGEVSLAGRTALRYYLDPERQASMGDRAIDHSKSKLVISENGDTELRLYFGPLAIATLSGYLQRLSRVTNLVAIGGVVQSYDLIPASIYEDWGDTHDDFWVESYGSYPKLLGIPVTPGETEIVVEMFVPVMEAIAVGSGRQIAWLRIDWSGVELGNGLEPADVTALSDAIADARTVNAANYTVSSRNALSASVAAGEWLIGNNETLTVTQAMVDARAAAIQAAQTALLAGTGEAGADPDVPDFPGDAAENTETVTVTPEVSDKTATATVNREAVAAALNAIDSASGTVTIKLDVLASAADVERVVLTISAEAARSIAEAAADEDKANVILAVESQVANVALDGAAIIAAFGTQGSAQEVTIAVAATATENLTAEQQNVIAGKTAVTIDITVGAVAVSDFESGEVAVSLPYAPANGQNEGKLRVYRLNNDASSTKLEGSKYENGNMIFNISGTP